MQETEHHFLKPRFGPLQEPDENGVRMPPGFTSRIVARSGDKPVESSDYVWHASPDGGGTFSTGDGGWIYVSNSELGGGFGGVGALKFDSSGDVISAYQILHSTRQNCAGGITPWNTWLSCEEVPFGSVWECDPSGNQKAKQISSLGYFKHEAAAVDPISNQIYMTEDERNGRLYRFSPFNIVDKKPDLSSGILEVAEVVGGEQGYVVWWPVPYPNPQLNERPTRRQVPRSTRFRGGEGICYHKGSIFFCTKGDNRVWEYNSKKNILGIVYDDKFFEDAELTGVDNITVSPSGDLFVAEDGGDMQIVCVTPYRRVFPVLQLLGHPQSELTGPAFSPCGNRLYFSSQRGKTGDPQNGITFEVCGPFGRYQ